ncbi:MinD/ParA family protein [Synechococcus elongatus IITB7]|uniref:MinD/ParA family ATP-binding protein n=1 Tax=Synechococcus elongatus TaxID=32046 RepID=UPI0030CE1046
MTQIVSIHSFRGGTGKSNMTANLATTLALQGHRVGVVDTDIQSPGIHVILGLRDEDIDQSLNDYLWGQCSIEQAVYDVTPAAVEQAGGRILLSPSSLNASKIAKILREGYDVGNLNDGFLAFGEALNLDFLLIDTHPGINEETLLSIAISDGLVMLMRPDRQDYLGTAVAVQVAKKLDVPKMFIAVNKVPSFFDFAEVRAKVESNYGVPVGALFPLADEVLTLASQGLLCIDQPQHPISVELRQLATALTSD